MTGPASADMATNRVPALQMEDVRKVYPVGDEAVVALDHADLTVGADEIVALVGPSGSGKTTLCSIAGGLLTPTVGRVVVGGADISGYSAASSRTFRRDKVGFVFQTVNLVPFLTARENLLVVDEIGSAHQGAAARDRADQLLDELGLADRAENLPAQLSGGQRQRVAIGRALMNEPDARAVRRTDLRPRHQARRPGHGAHPPRDEDPRHRGDHRHPRRPDHPLRRPDRAHRRRSDRGRVGPPSPRLAAKQRVTLHQHVGRSAAGGFAQGRGSDVPGVRSPAQREARRLQGRGGDRRLPGRPRRSRAAGELLTAITSVASFFLSGIDTRADRPASSCPSAAHQATQRRRAHHIAIRMTDRWGLALRAQMAHVSAVAKTIQTA